MEKTLLKNDEYAGKYVALRSRDDDTVVGSGDTPRDATREAEENGCSSPVLFYVPERQSVNIY
ncbi:MAG: hypothetical protein GF331_18465 [Chitinivibrionales bacterium]|nr:hypothetical protein [Chitinivibrionales bacterium]